MNMSKKKAQNSEKELGQMQNELTVRLCANCDCCAICWEQESTPLYVILSNIFSNGEIPELEFFAYEKEDRDKLIQFMIDCGNK